MTRPSVIFFGPDGKGGKGSSKVYLRTLLFCTAKRGLVIQSLFVRLSRGETRQNFSIWVLGEDKLSRGSGLYVGQEGLVANHHFLLPADCRSFTFEEGAYDVEVVATLLGEQRHHLLFHERLSVSRDVAQQLEQDSRGLYFDWGPDAGKYHPHVEERANIAFHEMVLESLRASSFATSAEGEQ